MSEPAANHPGLLRAAELAVEAMGAAIRNRDGCKRLEAAAIEVGSEPRVQKYYAHEAIHWNADAAANRARAEQYRGLVRAAEEAAALERAAHIEQEAG